MVDTNLLFAAAYPKDHHNAWAEEALLELRKFSIPCFTNINVRTEFLDLSRRVLIPEGLMDFYEDCIGELPSLIDHKLKSLRTRIDKATDRVLKMSDNEIKEWRTLMNGFMHPSGKKGWEVFCEGYLEPYFENVWEDTVKELEIKFVGTRAIDSRQYFETDPTWADANRIIGKTGIGSSDAMILNLFLCSKFKLFVSTDSDALNAMESLGGANKCILCPDLGKN